MEPSLLLQLLTAHYNGTLPASQRQVLFSLINRPENEQEVLRFLDELLLGDDPPVAQLPDHSSKEILQVIVKVQRPESNSPAAPVQPFTQLKGSPRLFRMWFAAAAILVVVTGGLLFWQYYIKSPVTDYRPVAQAVPAKPGAVLTLANGRQIILDSLSQGVIAQQGNASLLLNNEGLSYRNQDIGEVSPALMNTLSTPRARIFNLLLPDGTRVWLNAASSITFPVAFTGNTRTVHITGEAYLEVHPNQKQPFMINTNDGLQLQVLGTSFNVNAYPEEPVATATLISGAVRVNHDSAGVLLAPGEQAVLKKGKYAALQRRKDTDIDATIAWKNGLFAMKGMNVEALARQISRWYDVEVHLVPNAAFPDMALAGTISGDIPLSQLLIALKNYNIQSKTENGQLTLFPGTGDD